MSPAAAATLDPHIRDRVETAAGLAGLVVAATGAAVLAGWAMRSHAVVAITSGQVSMKPTTATGFVLAGSALALRTWAGRPGLRRLGQAAAVAAGALGVLSLIEITTGWDSGVDRVLFNDAVRAFASGATPGRMAPGSAAAFVAAAALLALRDRVRPSAAVLLGGGGVLLALMVLAGYAYGAQVLESLGPGARMALHTALAFLVLFIALTATSRTLPARLLVAHGSGGILVRRLVPVAVVVPFLLGGLRLGGQRLGLYGTEFGLSIMVVSTVLLFAVLLVATARSLQIAEFNRLRLDAKVASGQRALSQAEHRLQDLVDYAPAAIHVTATDGTLLLSNSTYDALHGLHRDLSEAGLRLRGPAVRQHEEVIDGPDGQHTWMAVEFPLLDDDGAAYATATISSDITERKRHEAALRESEQRLIQLLDGMPINVVLRDPAGRPVYMNTSAMALAGREPGDDLTLDRVPHGFETYLAGTDQPYPVEPNRLERVLQGEASDLDDIEVERSDGTRVRLRVLFTPIYDTQGTLVSALTASIDITEERRAADRLAAQAVELRRSNAELEKFAYVASHDLSEPLRTISGYVELLARRYQDRLDADADRYIGHAVDGCNRLRRLIDDLLTYSRAGRAAAMEPVDSGRVLTSVIEGLASRITETGATVGRSALPLVQGDPVQLAQVFQNLLGNALKFANGDTAPRICVSAERDGAQWRLCVADNGIGIDAAYRERIFEMFQRLHPRDAYVGTGIGLAICKRIVEGHGGEIWVEDEPGGGSRFCFTLNAAGGVPA